MLEITTVVNSHGYSGSIMSTRTSTTTDSGYTEELASSERSSLEPEVVVNRKYTLITNQHLSLKVPKSRISARAKTDKEISGST